MPKAKELLATALRLDDTNADGAFVACHYPLVLRVRLGCVRERIFVQSSWRPETLTPTVITDICLSGRRDSTKPSGN